MKSLLIVAGPTASGKTAVCLEIAKKIPVETLSFDSMQVYKHLPIVTQAPTAAQKKALRAHLVSFLEPSELFDAARFRETVLKLLPAIQKKKRIPLLSGGTGLYLRMLLDGLFESDGASSDPKLRAKLFKAQEKHGGTWLSDQLKKVDPVTAERIHANDHRRLVRALEVHALSGRPISERKLERRGIRADYHCPVFFLERERVDLYARVEKRVDAMMRAGLEKEVRRALKRKLGMTAAGALGIKEMREYIEKRWTKEEAVSKLKQHTRNYAKRQLSWFRHEKGVVPVPVPADEKPALTAKRILKMWEDSKS